MAHLSCFIAIVAVSGPPVLQAQDGWVALHWEGANGPRDVEYSRSSIKLVGDTLSVSLRRNRATALRQDLTIAPESNPWTTMDVMINCARNTWRLKRFASTDSTGALATVGNFGKWVGIDENTLVAVLKLRFCPIA